MDISIVVPVYNGATTIADCCAACLSQDYRGDYEVIVVDDGSIDETASIVKTFPVRYHLQKNAGPAAARNTGWKAASGKIVCFTDADCMPEPQWIQKISVAFAACGATAVGGSYTFAGADRLGKIIHAEIALRHAQISGNTDFLGSFNCSVKRDALAEVNGFDETYARASGEDNDLSYRLRKNGHALFFDKTITVEHRHTWTLTNYLRSQARHGFWRMKLYKDHPKMARGDQYAGIRDFALPPLSVFAIFLFVVRWIAGFSISLAILAILSFRRDPFLWLLVFARSFFRGFGMLFGAFRFFLKVDG